MTAKGPQVDRCRYGQDRSKTRAVIGGAASRTKPTADQSFVFSRGASALSGPVVIFSCSAVWGRVGSSRPLVNWPLANRREVFSNPLRIASNNSRSVISFTFVPSRSLPTWTHHVSQMTWPRVRSAINVSAASELSKMDAASCQRQIEVAHIDDACPISPDHHVMWNVVPSGADTPRHPLERQCG
jgi:hypothetical protein